MKEDKNHIEIRSKIEILLNEGIFIEEIANKLDLDLGTRYIRGSAKWYRYCIIAKMNQKKAIENHPNLYSKAGKIAQQLHPLIGHELGTKYGREQGKMRAQQLKGNSKYFSRIAKRLHNLHPEQSRANMLKAHQTMKDKGLFNAHQLEASLKCMKEHPHQLSDMSKKAHELYPLGLLALETRRKNCPYEFMDCLFDSNSERELCEILVKAKLMDSPREGENVHFRINRYHIDFFINDKVFIEFHPPLQYGRKKGETLETYFRDRRTVLDNNGYKNYPLIVIANLKNVTSQIDKIEGLRALELNE